MDYNKLIRRKSRLTKFGNLIILSMLLFVSMFGDTNTGLSFSNNVILDSEEIFSDDEQLETENLIYGNNEQGEEIHVVDIYGDRIQDQIMTAIMEQGDSRLHLKITADEEIIIENQIFKNTTMEIISGDSLIFRNNTFEGTYTNYVPNNPYRDLRNLEIFTLIKINDITNVTVVNNAFNNINIGTSGKNLTAIIHMKHIKEARYLSNTFSNIVYSGFEGVNDGSHLVKMYDVDYFEGINNNFIKIEGFIIQAILAVSTNIINFQSNTFSDIIVSVPSFLLFTDVVNITIKNNVFENITVYGEQTGGPFVSIWSDFRLQAVIDNNTVQKISGNKSGTLRIYRILSLNLTNLSFVNNNINDVHLPNGDFVGIYSWRHLNFTNNEFTNIVANRMKFVEISENPASSLEVPYLLPNRVANYSYNKFRGSVVNTVGYLCLTNFFLISEAVESNNSTITVTNNVLLVDSSNCILPLGKTFRNISTGISIGVQNGASVKFNDNEIDINFPRSIGTRIVGTYGIDGATNNGINIDINNNQIKSVDYYGIVILRVENVSINNNLVDLSSNEHISTGLYIEMVDNAIINKNIFDIEVTGNNSVYENVALNLIQIGTITIIDNTFTNFDHYITFDQVNLIQCENNIANGEFLDICDSIKNEGSEGFLNVNFFSIPIYIIVIVILKQRSYEKK